MMKGTAELHAKGLKLVVIYSVKGVRLGHLEKDLPPVYLDHLR